MHTEKINDSNFWFSFECEDLIDEDLDFLISLAQKHKVIVNTGNKF